MMRTLKELGKQWRLALAKTSPDKVDLCIQGMKAFTREFVVERQVPIPKLLYAFGICLVRSSTPVPAYNMSNTEPVVPRTKGEIASHAALLSQGCTYARVSLRQRYCIVHLILTSGNKAGITRKAASV